jgi:hypothetical protein
MLIKTVPAFGVPTVDLTGLKAGNRARAFDASKGKSSFSSLAML